MSWLYTAGGLAGGVGLFLLGMWMMTEGLKLSAGPQLEQMLARATAGAGEALLQACWSRRSSSRPAR